MEQQECNITGYNITLTYNYTVNEIAESYLIHPNSENNYVINDLIPGYQYSVKLTPWTSMGALKSSPINTITSMIMGKFIYNALLQR